jgi:hypothetical protein
MTKRDLKEVLEYALGGSVPPRFLEHLLTHRDLWDDEFKGRLEACAYELRPDLAVWELSVDESGYLQEERAPLLSQP